MIEICLVVVYIIGLFVDYCSLIVFADFCSVRVGHLSRGQPKYTTYEDVKYSIRDYSITHKCTYVYVYTVYRGAPALSVFTKALR